MHTKDLIPLLYTVFEPIYLILQKIPGSSFFHIHEVLEGVEDRISTMKELNSKLTFLKLNQSCIVCVY